MRATIINARVNLQNAPTREEFENLLSIDKHKKLQHWARNLIHRIGKYSYAYYYIDKHNYAIRFRKGRGKREIIKKARHSMKVKMSMRKLKRKSIQSLMDESITLMASLSTRLPHIVTGKQIGRASCRERVLR